MAPGAAARSRAAELVRRVRRIELATRRAVEETLSGQYHSVFKGRGMEFSEVRPYAPGDEVRAIDWNVSARTGQLHVKRFVEERELTVMLLCDASASTEFGSGERTKAEVAAEIAALLALSAVANGDRVGLALFTDRVERFVPPRRGRRHALRIVSEILSCRRAVEDRLSGQYHSVFKGQGMEFSEVRPYAPGDEVRTIDWNVSARTGQLHVKRFVEERELTVMVLCDVSASAEFGSGARTKAELAAEIAAHLALSAVANGDRVGLVLFTDRVERFVPPREGRRHALRIVSEILSSRPEGRRTAIGAALEFLRRALRRRTIAFVLSDFIEQHPFPFERALRIAARTHDVVPIRLDDALDVALPAAGIAWLEDPETGAVLRADLSDAGVRARFAAAARAEDEALRRLFARLELDAVSVRTDEADHVKPLLAFFRARARRLAG